MEIWDDNFGLAEVKQEGVTIDFDTTEPKVDKYGNRWIWLERRIPAQLESHLHDYIDIMLKDGGYIDD